MSQVLLASSWVGPVHTPTAESHALRPCALAHFCVHRKVRLAPIYLTTWPSRTELQEGRTPLKWMLLEVPLTPTQFVDSINGICTIPAKPHVQTSKQLVTFTVPFLVFND